MAYLIGTQVLIWALISPEKLSVAARDYLQTSTIYVSVISLFGIAIKQKIGKLKDLPVSTDKLVEQLKRDSFELMPLAIRHIAMYDVIQLLDDHRDPFDRLILATALAEQISVISADEKFSRYRNVVEVIW